MKRTAAVSQQIQTKHFISSQTEYYSKRSISSPTNQQTSQKKRKKKRTTNRYTEKNAAPEQERPEWNPDERFIEHPENLDSKHATLLNSTFFSVLIDCFVTSRNLPHSDCISKSPIKNLVLMRKEGESGSDFANLNNINT